MFLKSYTIIESYLKQTLKETGMTQKELAARLQVQTSTLCEWLNDHNEPHLQAVGDIAEFLGVSTDYLLGRKDF